MSYLTQETSAAAGLPVELYRFVLGQQVWANACVARRKYQAVGWGLVFLFSGGAALALVALDLALRSVSN